MQTSEETKQFSEQIRINSYKKDKVEKTN